MKYIESAILIALVALGYIQYKYNLEVTRHLGWQTYINAVKDDHADLEYCLIHPNEYGRETNIKKSHVQALRECYDF